ncbi:hypothetical protein OV079_27310 [Nannocystis pusilla]|uniref:Uncharacterized protein n=1 Tax=Nannocystis pusilla TaxID=889268 RepID=A0A9X3J0M8_9BACT|nr:hypothetical protein [Nannocystis pusilla]MCY1009208.1 hypothetical protein [Nannocystis pusilla]
MTQSDNNRARYYRVSAAKWPIEKYLLCDSAREAAEEFAALFDFGDLFDQVEITVSLADARGRRQTQQFTVRSSNMRVYEAVWVENVGESEPEEVLELEELGELGDVPLEGALDDSFAREDDLEEDDEFDEWVQREETGPFSELLPEDAGAAVDEPAVLKILAAANETDPPDDDPDDSSSSGLRRLAGLASRGYGTLVKGLFGRRRGRAA